MVHQETEVAEGTDSQEERSTGGRTVCRPNFVIFVRFVSFVVKTPFVSVPPLLL